MTAAEPILKAPFPYPGGKSRVADLVWSKLGNVDNYVEPFCGTLATLLKRPAEHFANGYRVETVNDANHYLVNFWRAVKHDPDAVAEYADWPVMEADLHARHKWLVRSEHAAGWRKRMAEDPDHFDAKMAGWWVWGQACWIGGAWCVDSFVDRVMRPNIAGNGSGAIEQGVHSGGAELSRKSQGKQWADQKAMPILDPSQKGVHSDRNAGRPQLTDVYDIGRGVHSGGAACTDWTQVPDLANSGEGRVTTMRRAWLTDWMRRLSDRLRLVRTCYGHWSRICDSDSTMTRLGLTGAFLDPPYPSKKADGTKSRDDSLYVNDKLQCLDALRDEVLAWCRKWAGPQIRIVVCGYEGDGYAELVKEGWTEQAWEAGGGYSNQRRGGKGKGENAKRERLWFSPSCLTDSSDLFAGIAA